MHTNEDQVAEVVAYQLLTQAGGLYVANMVDTTYSLVASVAKKHLSRSP